jgi:hypothetical protein
LKRISLRIRGVVLPDPICYLLEFITLPSQALSMRSGRDISLAVCLPTIYPSLDLPVRFFAINKKAPLAPDPALLFVDREIR